MAKNIQRPIDGIDGRVPSLGLPLTGAAPQTQNVLFEDGAIRTASGYSTFGTAASESVIGLYRYVELDSSEHALRLDRNALYRYDNYTSAWRDITESGQPFAGSADAPVTFLAIAHDDSDIYLDDDTGKAHAYYHCLISDGGNTNIRRWSGKYEDTCHAVLGGDDYHDGTTHRALTMGAYRTRVILISPKEYNSSSKIWIENNQRVRWPYVGKLQQWNGDYAGFVDLIDTGGINRGCGLVSQQFYIYQSNSIWDCRYVGGKTVFDPVPVRTDIGVAAPNLLKVAEHAAYFVGHDYNVYVHLGGSTVVPIGDKIWPLLLNDLSDQYLNRCHITLDAKMRRLWILIVPTGSVYATKAYGMDIKSEAWTIRDYSGRFGSTAGITAIALFGAGSYQTGQTYTDALLQVSPYEVSDAGDATDRYGDNLLDAERTLSVDATEASWCAGGYLLYCACGDVTWSADLTVGDIIRVTDGSNFTNCRYGTHFYTVCDVGDHTIWLQLRDASLGISDTTDVPADVSWTVYDPTGSLYSEQLATVLTSESIHIGDSSGQVYQCDPSTTIDATNYISSAFVTPVMDYGLPDENKRFIGVVVRAKERTSGHGRIIAEYRTRYFDTTETGWTTLTSSELSSDYLDYEYRCNVSARSIQWRFKNSSAGSDWKIESYKPLDPIVRAPR